MLNKSNKQMVLTNEQRVLICEFIDHYYGTNKDSDWSKMSFQNIMELMYDEAHNLNTED